MTSLQGSRTQDEHQSSSTLARENAECLIVSGFGEDQCATEAPLRPHAGTD
jgi:hypothetical protein